MVNWNFTTVSSVLKILCRVGRDHRTKAMARSSVSPQEKNWSSAAYGDAHHRAPTQFPRRSAGLSMHTLGYRSPEASNPTYPKARISPGREPGATKRGTGGHEKLPARLSPREQDRKIKVTGDDLPAPRTRGPRAGMACGRQLVC